jgi:hypothetical protein
MPGQGVRAQIPKRVSQKGKRTLHFYVDAVLQRDFASRWTQRHLEMVELVVLADKS